MLQAFSSSNNSSEKGKQNIIKMVIINNHQRTAAYSILVVRIEGAPNTKSIASAIEWDDSI